MAVPRKRKKKKGRVPGKSVKLPPAAAPEEQEELAASTRTPAARPKKQRRNLRAALYENNAEGLFRLVIFFPLFTGAWLAGGLVLDEVLPFLYLTAALIFAQYEKSISEQKVLFNRELRLMLGAGAVAVLLLFLQATGSWPWFTAAVLAVGLVTAYNYLSFAGPLSILCGAAAIACETSLFALLGIFSQIFRSEQTLSWQHACLGFVPGLILAAALIAQHAPTFEKAGWRRSTLIQKDSRTILRPRALATLFSLVLIIGPAIPVTLTPLARFDFPLPFLVCALAFIPLPRLLQDFLERREPDDITAVRCTNLAAAMGFLVFFAALISQLLERFTSV